MLSSPLGVGFLSGNSMSLVLLDGPPATLRLDDGELLAVENERLVCAVQVGFAELEAPLLVEACPPALLDAQCDSASLRVLNFLKHADWKPLTWASHSGLREMYN